jgi:hypothetical protein
MRLPCSLYVCRRCCRCCARHACLLAQGAGRQRPRCAVFTHGAALQRVGCQHSVHSAVSKAVGCHHGTPRRREQGTACCCTCMCLWPCVRMECLATAQCKVSCAVCSDSTPMRLLAVEASIMMITLVFKRVQRARMMLAGDPCQSLACVCCDCRCLV